MSDDWQSLASFLSGVLVQLNPGQFVIVEYDAGNLNPVPYAQAARESEGYYCEVVSQYYLPRDAWPILVASLEVWGWSEPSAAEENWWCVLGDDPFDVAEALIAGLRDGRACRDPSRFTCHVGTFPPGPGGGEPLPVPTTSLLRAA